MATNFFFNFDCFYIHEATAEPILNRLYFECSKVFVREMKGMFAEDVLEKFYDVADVQKAHDNAWLASFSLVCLVQFFTFKLILLQFISCFPIKIRISFDSSPWNDFSKL